MESAVHDTNDQSMESSDSGIKHVVEEEQIPVVNILEPQIGGLEDTGSAGSGVKHVVEEEQIHVVHNNLDPRIDRLENMGSGSAGSADHSDVCKVVTAEPGGHTQDEAKLPVSDILDGADAHNGKTGERLKMSKYPQANSTNVEHRNHASHNGAGLWSSGNGFELGDMLWAKVKSHPWWPGYIFSEAFASASVRRSKRDGQYLVAFFGDSSYGWFDAAELVHYEPYFSEKSQQSTSRNFVKAVEESIDESCRRSALGLTCFCRNSNNFRPTNVPSHVAVDVFNFEPGGIYSDDQILKSRDDFQPKRTLSFLARLAQAPRKATMTLDFVRLKAIAAGYRRSVFEEFDETYAQAFGHKAVRPVVAPPPTVDQSVQARLGGRLLVAESLSGGRKGSTKAKPKEQSKKDKYLFKRRDETGHMGTSQKGGDMGTSQKELKNSNLSSSSACEEGQSAVAEGDYVFQRRDQPASDSDQQEGATPVSVDGLTLSHSPSTAITGSGKEVRHAGPSTDEEKITGEYEGTEKYVNPPTGKKIKAGLLKGPSKKRLNAEKSDRGEKKKKRRIVDLHGSSDNLQKHSSVVNIDASGKGEIPGREGTTIPTGAQFGVESQPKGITTSSASPHMDFVPSGADTDPLSSEKNDSELQQVLADLKSLAVDPFHGRERNRPAIALQLYLKVRSDFFVKSSAALPTALGDTEASEVPSARTSSGGAGNSSYPPGENPRSAPPSRPPKPPGRTENPAKGGRKRVQSERQEEVAAKRAKKLSSIKSAVMPTEKRKAHEMQNPDSKGKGPAATPLRVGSKGELVKKKQPPKMRAVEPTFLVMKYPPGTSLPSSTELKARFARFGPMDTSQNRVFYTTNTCRICFVFKEDAESAHRFALGNKSDYANVRFMLRPHGVAPDPQADKSSRGSSSTRAGEEMTVDNMSHTPSSPIQLKSCLKKSAGDEGGSQNSGGVRNARVRFNMEETKAPAGAGGRIKMIDPRSNNSSSFPEVGIGSSNSDSLSIPVDVRSNQPEAFSKKPLQPPLVSAPQFPSVTHNHPPSIEPAPENYAQHTYTNRLPPPPSFPLPPPPPRSPVDISQQMLSLLTRCDDVVTNVKSMLGYVPYRPL